MTDQEFESDSERSDRAPSCVSFEQFVHIASKLYDSGDSDGELAHWLLSGVYDQDQTVHIHNKENFIKPDRLPKLKTTRDLDSLIAVSRTLPYRCSIPIQPVPSPGDQLSKDVHITVPVTRLSVQQEELTEDRPLHKFGNWGICSFEPHTLVRIAFPHLDPADATPEKHGELYEQVILPAAMVLQETREAEWPASFELACLHARRLNGTIVPRAHLIAASDVPAFGREVIESCDSAKLPWARDAFFIHQIKGVKAATSVEVDWPGLTEEDEAINREHSLDALMVSFTQNPFGDPFDQAYVDIGLEVSRPGFVLHWDRDSHGKITDFVLHNATAARDLTQMGRKGYWCDYASLLASTAGFRASIPPSEAGMLGTVYIQAYCTDKHISSTAGMGTVALHVNASDVLAQNAKAWTTMKTMYHQALAAATRRTGANARLEVRLKLEHAAAALPIFDVGVLTGCVLSYHATSWWQFKALMITVCRRLLQEQCAGSPQARTDHRTLTLTAGLIHFVNATQNRPATGRAEHSLLCCILPVTHQQGHPDRVNGRDGNPWANQDRDDHDTSGPIVSTGMFHMRSLRLSDESIIPRMASKDKHHNKHPTLPHPTYLWKPELCPKPIQRPVRSRGRIPFASVQSQQASGIIPPEFTAQQMARFRGQKTMVLSENDDSGELDDKEIDLPEQFSTIWCSFPYQILRALPTPRGRHSLSVYHHFQENGGDEEEEEDPAPLDENWMRYMKSNELGGGEGFIRCGMRTADGSDWRKCFDYLFPGKDQIDPATSGRNPQPLVFSIKSQGYPQVAYHSAWMTLMKESTQDDSRVIRNEIYTRFNELRWVPWANKAKMWETRTDDHKERRVLGVDMPTVEACPRICVNPRFAHLLTWNGDAIHLSKRLRVR
ncbi:hypothetical protein BS47DRAFT_1362050 [Hydnum rufescens UP504]|uniref:Uncharacterized protein n=1 Tax=Hydnum rufescens UP504 TaxID=1448309 RepID=A0A9P6AY55_9AGAM|nr:hypothetical protein BS47DRAFT_1362050 [Hydnum rufescens UP504]